VADLVVGVVGNILRHIAIEILQRGNISWIPGIGIVVMIYDASEFVILLPQIGLNELDRCGGPQERDIALAKVVFAVGEQRTRTGRSMSAQCEKFLIEQSRKFLFEANEPMEIGGKTGAVGIERTGTGSAEGAA
jgi:hypothetical protein